MAKKTILISDISGEEISDSEHVIVTFLVNGNFSSLDAKYEEIKFLIEQATEKPRRGRRPKAKK